jgi:lipoyl(octanoyl) transferase
MAGLDVRWLGLVGYERALVLQDEIARSHATSGDVLLLLEHEPVYTTGRGGREENLPGKEGRSPADGVPLFRVGRGGDATYHGPGQLVGYPLIDLRRHRGGVHGFLRALERGVVATLGTFGIASGTIAGQTGVWLPRDSRPPRKIASIGIGVRRGISVHGFALNVSVDLQAFASIVPCGIPEVEMTSMAAEGLLPVPSVERVAMVAARIFPAALAGSDLVPRAAGAGA